MQQELTSYCPQCLLVVFAAMGFYQYVLRDRILGGDSPDDELLAMNLDEMDESTQFLLPQMLANDHRNAANNAAEQPPEPDARSA